MYEDHSDLVIRAAAFAGAAHARIDQRRKYTNEPYINHPQAVATLVAEVTDDPVMIAAAWLHDTVEDTGVTHEQICREFGAQVGRLVYWLTDISKPEDGNRLKRKALDRNHIAQAPVEAMTVKLADLIDNARTIAANDPDFARVYMKEKRALLAVLQRGDDRLLKQATAIVEGYFAANPEN